MNALLAVLVPLGFFGLLALSALYVDARLCRLIGWAPNCNRRLVSAFLLVASVGATGLTATSASSALGWVYLAGGYILSFQIFLVMALLAQHALETSILEPRKTRRWHAGLALGMASAATVYGGIQASDFVIRDQVIRLPNLAKPVTVVHLSDVHLGHHRGRDYLQRLVSAANAQHPDFVVITGDLVDALAGIKPEVLQPLSGLTAQAFFVGGNHENYIDAELTFKLVKAQGIRVLRNELVETHGLQLMGLEYMNADDQAVDLHPSSQRQTIKSVLAGTTLRPGTPAVLLHHSPVGLNYADAAGFDLMLAGHTHGGQFCPNTILASMLFEFNDGLYSAHNTQVYVSPGAGTFISRMRLGSQNEVAVLKLLPKDAR